MDLLTSMRIADELTGLADRILVSLVETGELRLDRVEAARFAGDLVRISRDIIATAPPAARPIAEIVNLDTRRVVRLVRDQPGDGAA